MKYDANPEKGKARRFALHRASGQWKSALLLPSGGCLDVLCGLNEQWFNKKTKIVAVENDPKMWPEIDRHLQHLGMSYTLVADDLSNTLLLTSVDLMWLDFCGELNSESLSWLKTNRGRLQTGGSLSLTLSYGFRGRDTWSNQTRNICLNGRHKRAYQDYCSLIGSDQPEVSVPAFLVEQLAFGGGFCRRQFFKYNSGPTRFPMIMYRWDGYQPH